MYDTKQKQMIHQLLSEVFSSDELDNFGAENFPEIHGHFAPDMSDGAKIRLLIETSAKQGHLGKLVRKIRDAKPEVYQTFVDAITYDNAEAEPSVSVVSPPPTHTTVTTFPKKTIEAPLAARLRGVNIVPNAEALLSQSLAGRYQIDEMLDKSGMAAVFKARDTKLDIDVAIKIIDLQQVQQPTIVERVRQEVRTSMTLDHPGIVKVYDFGQTEALLYIIMEFIPGYNLRQARQYFKTLDSQTALSQVLQLFEEICLIVDYMHHKQVLHSGTRPENIMLKQNQPNSWQPVMINLGFLRPNKETVMSHGDISVDKLSYTVSPELLLGHSTDIRADVYALGILLYDLVAGRRPFKPRNISEAVRMHVETPPPPFRPDLPEEVREIILKAMAKNPADRYLSAKEMAQALAKCLVKPQLAAPAEPEVVVLMDTQPLVVAPGNSLTHKITLHNKGGQEDRCQVRVEGIPPEWVSISPSAATLAPEQRQEVEIAIYPPRAPQSRAGRYPTSIQVISQQSSKQVDEIKTILTVASYSQFSCALWPQEISTSQISKVTIENQGNAPETFTVTPTPDKGLGFKPEQARVKVAAGESNTAGFAVSSQRQLLVARRASQTFSIDVASAQAKTAETLSGQVSSRGLLPPTWAFAILLIIALFVCGLFSVYYSVRSIPEATAVNIAAPQDNAAPSAEIGQATATAETLRATAQWLSQDSDGDGLVNGEELQYNTSPDNSDSDGDGLPDGAEIKELNTDPTRKDSDFDGVPDDEEVKNIWNPDSRDTDGDGTPDAFDDNPNQQPTPTPQSTVAPTETPVPHTISFTENQPFLGQPQGWPFPAEPFSYRIDENRGPAVVEIEIIPPAGQQVQVVYAVNEGNATLDQDYGYTYGTIVLAAGERRQSFQVGIINDSQAEGDEGFFLILKDPLPAGIQLGTSRIELIITDND